MTGVDPSTMTETERLVAIAEVLARGFQRVLGAEIKQQTGPKNSRDPLDASAVVEAACGSDVVNPKRQEPAA